MVTARTRGRQAHRKWTSLFFALLLAGLACGVVAAGQVLHPQGDTGSFLFPQGSMTDAEARSMLDEQVAQSRFTVSLRPVQELVDGRLHLNFVVAPGNNGLSERLEIEQDGREVYASGIVEPEHVIEWGDAPFAHVGNAIATVYAVDSAGNDFGNPVSVEIEVVS